MSTLVSMEQKNNKSKKKADKLNDVFHTRYTLRNTQE